MGRRRLLLAALLLAGCEAAPPAAPAPPQPPPDLGPSPPSVGGIPQAPPSVRGSVTLLGEPPAPRPWYRSETTQPPRLRIPRDNDFFADRRVRWAFVSIVRGLEGRSFDAPAERPEIRISGYRFWPRVVGVRTGQDFRVLNEDDDLHNVHALPFANGEFNLGMPRKGLDTVRRFSVPEQMVAIIDDIHPWQKVWLGVVEHPFFAVTGPDGRFELRGLAPGTYTLGVWHERCYRVERTLEIKAGETRTEDFALDLRKD
jgi:hypothetical protein